MSSPNRLSPLQKRSVTQDEGAIEGEVPNGRKRIEDEDEKKSKVKAEGRREKAESKIFPVSCFLFPTSFFS
jgi:hypothetical protein